MSSQLAVDKRQLRSATTGFKDSLLASRALTGLTMQALRMRHGPLLTYAQKREDDLAALRRAFEDLPPKAAALEHNSRDPEANLALGRYHGLLKGNWQKALPLLVQGNEARLSDLARRDLAAPRAAAERAALADGWWDLAAAGPDSEKRELQGRAGYWYRKAISELTGLTRTRAEQRLRTAEEQTVALPRPLDPELRRFEGHTSPVWTVAFSPDGRQALSGSGVYNSEKKAYLDGTMCLWDVATGKEVRRFEGHTGAVWGVAFGPDGRQALSGSGGILRLWDVATGQQVRRFVGQHAAEPMRVALSPDGRQALSGGGGYDTEKKVYIDTALRLWDVATGKELRRFVGHPNGVTSVVFAPVGRLALSGSADNVVRVWALDSVTAKDVPTLTRLCRHPTAKVRTATAVLLGTLGAEAREAIPALVALTRDADAETGLAAALTLNRLVPETPIVVPVLLGGLKGRDRDQRLRCLRALGQIGPAARDGVPGLIDLLKDDDLEVRTATVETLGKIGSEARAAVPALAELLTAKEPALCLCAIQALGKISPKDPTPVPALVVLLKEPDLAMRTAAVNALAAMGPEAKGAVPALVDLLKDEKWREVASVLLGKIGPEAKAAVPALVDLLKDDKLRDVAMTTLGAIGPEAKAAVPKLIAILAVADLKEKAANTLKQIGKGAVPDLVRALEQSPPHPQRPQIIALLGDIGPDARDAVAVLTKLAENEFPTVRRQAKDALTKIQAKP